MTGGPTEDRTEVWAGYDDKALYFAFRCFDAKPEGIVGREVTPNAELSGDDNVTGTAQRGKKQDTSLFVGFGPLPNPRYVVVIVIEEGGFGRQAGAGVRRVFEGLCGLPVLPVRSVTSGGEEN